MDPCGQLQNRFVHTPQCADTLKAHCLLNACPIAVWLAACTAAPLHLGLVSCFRLAMCFLQLMHILVVIAMAHLHRGATLDFQDFDSGRACR